MGKYKERVEIGCYTNMSEMKGISTVKEYINEAKKRGWKAIGITDENSTQAFLEAQEYIEWLEENQLKIIYGVKVKFIDDVNLNEINDITILVKEQKGLKNLYTILSDAFCNKTEGKNFIYRSQLDKYRDGLLYGISGLKGNSENLDEKIRYYDFIQIEPTYREINKKIIELGDKNNILVVASSNPLYVDKKDSICNEILNHYKGVLDCEYSNERYLHTTEEMLQKFDYLDRETAERIVIDNTNILADMCEKISPMGKIKFEERYPQIEHSKEMITDECYKNVHKIYGKKLHKEVEKRLDLELNSIIENGFETIYLIASDCVKKSNELGYPVGTRGSVGNSFVAFLLGITDYNPLDYNLSFEIFAGRCLGREPDIDLNISREISPKIYEYINEKYCGNNIVYCGTFGTMSEKTATQMVDKYINDLEYSIDEKRKIKIIEKLMWIKRSTGVHPGGMFIIPKNKDIKEYTPIEYYKFNDKILIKTHMDYHFIWLNGIYKFDIINHDTPTILQRLKDMTKVNYDEIDFNDKETLEVFFNVGNDENKISTLGIPEFGTDFMINMLKLAKPKNFDDLISLSGFAHGTGTWYDNAESLIRYENIPIQRLISSRDDIMNYLISKGISRNKSFEISEFVRKGKAEKVVNILVRNQYYEGVYQEWQEYKKIMLKCNIPEWYINSCEKIKYLFPKAHAIGYVRDSYRIAWYKVHYPDVFYKVYFEIYGDIDIKKYDIKQIEIDYYNKVFILLNNGNLYRNGELIDNKICKIYMFDRQHLYKITEENKIRPIYEDDIWDNKDKYLNNNNCSYKKIVTSTLHIVALTADGNVIAIHGLSTGLGIEPENFKNVEDISIVKETKDIEIPYILKNNTYKPLYIEQ